MRKKMGGRRKKRIHKVFFFLFEEILGEKHRGARNEQLQPSLSKYVSCYSWNSYPYSISLYVRF